MMRQTVRVICLLVAGAGVAAELPPPFMALRWNGTAAESPATIGKSLEALGQYPSCFDAIRFFGKSDGQAVDALRKSGLAVDVVENRAPAPSYSVDDHAPRGIVEGALRFAAGSPQAVAVIGNGRHCASGKTAHGLCVESLFYLSLGASGLEYDLMGYAHEPSAWYANTYMSELTLWRPFYQAYVRHNAGTQPGGVLPFCGKEGPSHLDGALRSADALAFAGLPLCPGSAWPVCYVLNAESVESMTAVDIQRVLSGGAILDGGAVARLQARGYGAAMQLTATPREPVVREVFTDDELNLNRVGYIWQPEASCTNTYALSPSNEAARVIGRYQRLDGSSAEAASVLTETASGGRIAAFGFAGFTAEISAARRRQLLLAADWVAQGRLPVFVETVSQAVVVPRVTMAGDLRSVTVLNASIDVQPPITLRLRGCKEGLEAMEWVTPKEKPVTVSVRWEGKDVIAVLPAIGPWQIGWLRPTITE